MIRDDDSPREKRPGGAAVALALAFLAGAAPGAASIFTVTRTDDQLDTSPGDGFCVAQNGGGCSLRAAIEEANAHGGADSIYLPAGTYVLDRAGAGEELAATGDLDVTSLITLVGDGWKATTIHMAGAYDRVFDVQGFSSLDLEDVTVEGGFVLNRGGGIRVQTGGGLTLRRSRIRLCTSREGGAIAVEGGVATIEDSEIADNYTADSLPDWSGRGAGVLGLDGATLTVRRSSVHDNFKNSDYDGIEVWSAALVLESSTVYDDGASYYSVYGEGSSVSIVSSTVRSLEMAPDDLHPEIGDLTLGCSFVRSCALQGVAYTDYGANVHYHEGECIGVGDVVETWGDPLSALMAPPGKFPARVPRRESAAVDGGNEFVCLQNDQWSQARPADGDGDQVAVIDIGAVEAILVFADGFDRDGWNPWTSQAP